MLLKDFKGIEIFIVREKETGIKGNFLPLFSYYNSFN